VRARQCNCLECSTFGHSTPTPNATDNANPGSFRYRAIELDHHGPTVLDSLSGTAPIAAYGVACLPGCPANEHPKRTTLFAAVYDNEPGPGAQRKLRRGARHRYARDEQVGDGRLGATEAPVGRHSVCHMSPLRLGFRFKR